jgi:hypothetical protein
MGGDFLSGSGGGFTGDRFPVPWKALPSASLRLAAHVPTMPSSI